MLAAILISSVSSAETSPRGELEDFFGQVTAILSVATNAKQAREDVRYLARALLTAAKLPAERAVVGERAQRDGRRDDAGAGVWITASAEFWDHRPRLEIEVAAALGKP